MTFIPLNPTQATLVTNGMPAPNSLVNRKQLVTSQSTTSSVRHVKNTSQRLQLLSGNQHLQCLASSSCARVFQNGFFTPLLSSIGVVEEAAIWREQVRVRLWLTTMCELRFSLFGGKKTGQRNKGVTHLICIMVWPPLSRSAT